jgi:hypothetical protein
MRTLKWTAARYIQIHFLMARMHANRNEDGTLKQIDFGGHARSRSSSQTNKCAARYNDDLVTGITTIEMPDGSKVPQTVPSKKHLTNVLKALAAEPGDENLKKRVVTAIYKKLVGEQNSKGKADKKNAEDAAQLTKTQDQIAKLKEEIAAETDAKKKNQRERYLAAAQNREQKLKGDIREAGGQVDEGESEAESAELDNDLQTKQMLILSPSETARLTDLAQRALRLVLGAPADKPKDEFTAAKEVVNAFKRESGEWKTLRLGCGIQAAVFGRPAYNSDLTQTVEHAAVGYAHLVSVHEQAVAYDTFTAIDRLVEQNTMTGAGMFGEQPISWAFFYGYVYIDTRTLLKNIEAGEVTESEIAAEVVRRLILTTNAVQPHTKEGSLASKNRTALLLVEVGNAQPANLSDAFLEPIQVDDDHPDMKTNTFDRLAKFIEVRGKGDSLWNENKRAMQIENLNPTHLTTVVPTVLSIQDLAEWAVATANGEVTEPKKANGHKVTGA